MMFGPMTQMRPYATPSSVRPTRKIAVSPEKAQISEPTSWMIEVTTIENFTPKRCMTSMPGNARSIPAIEKTPMIWDNISTDIPRSAPMY